MQLYKTTGEDPKLFIADVKFEYMPISDTYRFGQQISHSDAGDYLEFNKYTILDKDDEVTSFLQGEVVLAYNDPQLFNKIIENISKDSYNLHQETVLAYNYWDGSNWKTLTLSGDSPFLEFFHERSGFDIIEDYKDAQFLTESFGTQVLCSDQYVFTKHSFQGTWYIAMVQTTEEYHFAKMMSQNRE